MVDDSFWDAVDRLLASSQIVIDRPRGSAHPRYPDVIYPLDYGYLAGTTSSDGGGIDVWQGSDRSRRLTGLVCTVDFLKKDMEIKLLVGCNDAEMQTIAEFHCSHLMNCLLVKRERVE